MEAVRRLHNLGNHTRLERHRRIRKCRPENRLRRKPQFAALPRAARVLRINTGQCREFLTVDNSLTDAQQPLLHRKIRSLAVRIDTDLAQLILNRNHRQVRCISLGNILLHIVRSQFRHCRSDLRLHLLGKRHILKLLLPFLTKFIHRLAVGLLHIVITPELCTHLVDTLRQSACHHLLVHREGIHTRLHQEKLRLKHTLQLLATHIPVGIHPLHTHIQNLLLQFRQ